MGPKRDMVEFNFPGPIVASRNNDVGIIGILFYAFGFLASPLTSLTH